MKKERRQHTRYKVDLYTQVITPDYYISLNTVEISLEGIRIEAYSAIPPGTEVTLSFELEKKLSFSGKVIWVFAFQKDGVQKYQIGIKIEEMTLEGIRVIGFDIRNELIQDILNKIIAWYYKTRLRRYFLEYSYFGSGIADLIWNPMFFSYSTI